LGGAICLSTAVLAQESILGRSEFQARCSVCHGDDAKGGGQVGELFAVKPKDLTQLAKENNGIYPFSEVYQAINGRREIVGHGRSEMPVWGEYFREDALEDRSSIYGLDAEHIVQGRILSLVYFLQSIQE
jgi:mono/diheme cytochrome c family protein